MFPEGEFYILSRKHGFALDVYDGQTKEDANIIVWPQKFQDSDNQLWSFVNGRLINKKSGHALDISSSAFRRDKIIVQKKVKGSKQSQEWVYDQGYICSKEYPTLVLDIRGDSEKGGAQILLYKRKDSDNLNQQWHFEPYQQFEHTLNMATTSLPLHKKEGFGQPRLGYGAEVGIPEELKKLPDDIKVAGVGNNVSATPTTDTPDHSRKDPALAQYGSFYGEANFQMPSSSGEGAQPNPNDSHAGLGPDNANTGSYPPPPVYPPPSSSDSPGYPPHSDAHQQQLGYPQPSTSSGFSPHIINQQPNYPQPSTSSGFPEPYSNQSGPQGQSNAHGYPAPSYAASPSDFPQAPLSPSNYTQSGAPGYPSNNAGYPPSAYPPNNTNSGYPPSPSGYPPPPSSNYPPPPSGNYPPPSSGNYPPPPPSYGRPQQEQYGYPSYPQ
ncbi:hypothetical protein CU098_013117 [Rhizopus stolonifer]|uniref:Ricin B lectin domain-containing protein n=1 Tax=Rhizopus stolonifer TaxID=4846 RepID=A0A367KSS1_RHIST|nr:hypothetical protein CU098_013117 [Rhizopus stolonifer]